MKQRSLVPKVSKILPEDVESLPELQETIAYWNHGSRPMEDWLSGILEEYGHAGLVSRRGEKVLGFCVFGPRKFFPRAELMSLKFSYAAVFLAGITGDRRTKKHLLVRTFKEIRDLGTNTIEAAASDIPKRGSVSTGFLVENGWRPVDHTYHRGRTYTLMRAELGSTVEIGELARDIIGRVKLPRLKDATPEPSTLSTNIKEHRFQNDKTAVLKEEIPSGVVA